MKNSKLVAPHLAILSAVFFCAAVNARADDEAGVMAKKATAPSLRESQAASTDFFSEFANRSSFTYYTKLSGPSLGAPTLETYNVYTSSVWPLQLFHSLDYSYGLTTNDRIGFGVSGLNDLHVGVKDSQGNLINPSSSIFHPTISYSRDNLANLDGVVFSGGLTATIPTSEFAISQGQILSLAFDLGLSLPIKDKHWGLSFSSRVQPTFYKDIEMTDPWVKKQIWLVTGGHNLSYKISDQFDVTHSTSFDGDFYFNGPGTFEPASEDRTALQLNAYTKGGALRLGFYGQTSLYSPSLLKTTVGIDLTLNFTRL